MAWVEKYAAYKISGFSDDFQQSETGIDTCDISQFLLLSRKVHLVVSRG